MELREEKENKDEEEYIKVTVSKKAEAAIGNLLAKVNEGFNGGRVSRQDLISWVLVRFSDGCDDEDIRSIRADHFDEITLLELCLKRSNKLGVYRQNLKNYSWHKLA